MKLNKWITGFNTIYESIWVGISKEVKVFSENDILYRAELASGQVYSLNKHDIKTIESFLKDKKAEILFGVEKQTGMCTEILMEFQFKGENYRVLVSYGLEGNEQIDFYAWGNDTFPDSIEIAKQVCNILLDREPIKSKHRDGLLAFNYNGIVNKHNCNLSFSK